MVGDTGSMSFENATVLPLPMSCLCHGLSTALSCEPGYGEVTNLGVRRPSTKSMLMHPFSLRWSNEYGHGPSLSRVRAPKRGPRFPSLSSTLTLDDLMLDMDGRRPLEHQMTYELTEHYREESERILRDALQVWCP